MHAVHASGFELIEGVMWVTILEVSSGHVFDSHMAPTEVLSAAPLLTPHLPMALILSFVDAASCYTLLLRFICCMSSAYEDLLLHGLLACSKERLGRLLTKNSHALVFRVIWSGYKRCLSIRVFG